MSVFLYIRLICVPKCIAARSIVHIIQFSLFVPQRDVVNLKENEDVGKCFVKMSVARTANTVPGLIYLHAKALLAWSDNADIRKMLFGGNSSNKKNNARPSPRVII